MKYLWLTLLTLTFFALPMKAQPQVLKVQVSGGQPNLGIDWMRLEIEANKVNLLHTTQTLRIVFMFPSSEWADHSVVATVFRPDGCQNLLGGELAITERMIALKKALDEGLIEPNEYASNDQILRSKLEARSGINCLVFGMNSLLLPPNTDIYKGTWTVLYQLSPSLSRYLTFRVPMNEGTNIEAELLKKQGLN
jgi:hypothetical protein